MMKQKRTFFSLIEMVVVLAVLMVIVSLLSPALNKMTAIAHTVDCKSNLKVIYQGISIYTEDYDNVYPGPCAGAISSVFPTKFILKSNGYPRHGSMTLQGYLSLYLDSQPLNNYASYSPNFICPANDAPSDKVYGWTMYALKKVIGQGRPFGHRANMMPFSVDQLQNPAKHVALSDAFDLSKKYGGVSHTPVHFKTNSNELYFDGKVHDRLVLP